MYKDFEQLIDNMSSEKKQKVVVASAQDAHALEAVMNAYNRGVIDYVLVGNGPEIMKVAEEHGIALKKERIVQAADEQEAAYKAVEVIRNGEGDFLMKGKMTTPTLLKEVVNSETGIRTDHVISHVAILQVPAYHKLICVTDGGMIPHPDLNQKTSIIENAVAFFNSIGYKKPKVAIVTASESENPRMPETSDAFHAAEKFAGSNNCIVQGPLSLDLALSSESAAIKGISGPVIGDVDIMVTPDIASGNMLTKAMIYTGNALMAGCIVGAKVPIVLTSRGATAEEKYLSLVISAASCK